MHRFVPRGIRLRLVMAISAATMATVAGSFFVLHEATSASLRSRIDRELNEQYAEFQQRVLAKPNLGNPASLRVASDRFVAGQRYHPEARIFLKTLAERHPNVTAAVDPDDFAWGGNPIFRSLSTLPLKLGDRVN